MLRRQLDWWFNYEGREEKNFKNIRITLYILADDNRWRHKIDFHGFYFVKTNPRNVIVNYPWQHVPYAEHAAVLVPGKLPKEAQW